MPRRQQRKRRRVNNPQTLYPKHPSLRIHHRTRIARLPHLTGPGRMVNARRTLHYGGQYILITSYIHAWEDFGPGKDGLYRARLKDLSRAAKSCDGDLLVSRVGQPIRADDRIDICIY